MKKVYSLIICLLVGISFLVLLYLQGMYATAMVRMREEQFDENVRRSIDQASRDMERSETYHYLENVINRREQEKQEKTFLNPNRSSSVSIILDSTELKKNENMQTVGRHPNRFPNSLTMPRPNRESLNQFSKQVQEAYMYERGVLEEVIFGVMRSASTLRFQDRIIQAELDNFLRGALLSNGINLNFHYIVYTADGREVYRCEDYTEDGTGHVYQQLLFRSDPT